MFLPHRAQAIESLPGDEEEFGISTTKIFVVEWGKKVSMYSG